MTDLGKAALLSVFDKNGIDVLAKGLSDLGYSIISSGGTHRFLEGKGINTTRIEDVTGSPEVFGGRVKTLHPVVFGGILFRREDPSDRRQASAMAMPDIDVVAVNLYPFEATISKACSTVDDCIEQIDIGGPSLIRAAAKNHSHVSALVDPDDYGWFLERLSTNGGLTDAERLDLALKAFRYTSSYDIAIGDYLEGLSHPGLPWGDSLRLRYEKAYDLRYGENPHQMGAYFRDPSFGGISIANSRVLWGKELSFNNIYDVDAVLDILMDFKDETCCAIIKHNNPSGVAVGGEGAGNALMDAYRKAVDCDPLSSYGGIIGLNRICDAGTAAAITERFYEVVIAPGFEDDALETLKTKKNLRIISTDGPLSEEQPPERKFVKVRGGILVQTMVWPAYDPSSWRVVTEKVPTEGEVRDLLFAMKVVKHVKSNCVVMAKDMVTTGIGSGQMSRVDSCFMAVHKAGDRASGSVLASDAFFPFRDGIDTLADSGITAISQPGGSVRDAEVIQAANEAGIAMVFTGIRLFKH